jgi:glutaredoxin
VGLLSRGRGGRGDHRDHRDHSAEHEVALLTKPGCHLCDDARVVLTRLAAELGFALTETDATADPAVLERWHDELPVIFVDGRQHGYWRVEEQRLRAALRAPRPEHGVP